MPKLPTRTANVAATADVANVAATADVAIIGGGFSGTALAIHLARAGGVRVVLFESRAVVGRGVAYSAEPWHRLNVRAAGMSIFPDQPNHFVEWARQRDPDVTPASFVRRVEYGAYVGKIFSEARAGNPEGITVIGERATELLRHGNGWVVTSRGARVQAATLVLATGNGRPASPVFIGRALAHPRYVADPWADGALGGLEPDGDVLILGTGLTMADVVLSLREYGHRGKILALSRRGRLPATHLTTMPNTPVPSGLDANRWVGASASGVGALCRAIRQDVATNAAAGVPWHVVLDQVRFAVPALWTALSSTERRRFLRHLRPWWDTHRHRLPPEVASVLGEQVTSGNLEIAAGRLLGCSVGEEMVVVDLCRRGSLDVETRHFSAVINATGTESRPEQDPLLAPLIAGGALTADALGLPTDAARHPLNGSGVAIRSAYVLGPALRSTFWEATAVPELSRHAAAVAAEILAGRGARDG